MPGTLSFEEYGAAIGAASTVLRANAGAVSLDAPVPTCPEWTVRDLVAHQGMVHRWATRIVGGEHPREIDVDEIEAGGLANADLLGWFDEGATALLQALSDAPADVDVWFFLKNAGPSRDAWARRQAHETTIHAVDAMAARLGVPPSAAEVWFDDQLAVDGADELLSGFLPRGKTPLRSPEPRTVAFMASSPTLPEAAWLVEVSAEPAVTTRHTGEPAADLTVSGSPRALYLALWNRGSDVEAAGDTALLDLWRETMKVTW